MRRLARFQEDYCPLPVFGHPKSGTTWLQLLTSRMNKRNCQFCDCVRTSNDKHTLNDLKRNHVDIFRHPCDVAVSMYYFRDINVTAHTLDDYVLAHVADVVAHQNIQFVRSARVTLVTYEALCARPVETLTRVAHDFHMNLTESDLAEIVTMTSFEEMRAMERSRQMILDKWPDSASTIKQGGTAHIMTRTGCNSSFRAVLSPRVSARCAAHVHNRP